ncbi:hypothetical protein [Rhodococcus sp. SORGH_AS_0303]|uniref:hypothetical protein n=1 Tax=Rhodococcus sp. SORGH_AS_0303 TaxID=3041753 RepID=UPI0027831C7E|nr:hypothetical protein [Rhodococcus sp. SORGH_AS_0303]MDQ1201087.1 hypothetical protein [Rhodococcus sp. SORGH_AS_0303]
MSLTDLHAEVAEYREQAGALAEEFSRIHTEVTSDRSLTAVGQREQLEPLHAEVAEKMRALHAREKAAVQGLKENLERRVFGLSPSASTDPSRLVSYRDAAARARQLDNGDDATELYESAKRSGDDILATAVMERAMVRGWSTVTNDYLDRNPAARDDLGDLTSLAKYSDNGLMSTVHYVPPRLDLPRSAGFPKLGGQTTHAPAPSAPDLAGKITGFLSGGERRGVDHLLGSN